MTGLHIELTTLDGRAPLVLDGLIAALGTTEPLMADVAAVLLSQAERQFQTQSGPRGPWPALSPVTLALRARRGVAGSPMLQISGAGLAASVQSGHTATEAWVGSNKPYARMQFHGGITSPRSMIPGRRIPPRPYLPFDVEAGRLTPEAEEAVFDVLDHHLDRHLGR